MKNVHQNSIQQSENSQAGTDESQPSCKEVIAQLKSDINAIHSTSPAFVKLRKLSLRALEIINEKLTPEGTDWIIRKRDFISDGYKASEISAFREALFGVVISDKPTYQLVQLWKAFFVSVSLPKLPVFMSYDLEQEYQGFRIEFITAMAIKEGNYRWQKSQQRKEAAQLAVEKRAEMASSLSEPQEQQIIAVEVKEQLSNVNEILVKYQIDEAIALLEKEYDDALCLLKAYYDAVYDAKKEVFDSQIVDRKEELNLQDASLLIANKLEPTVKLVQQLKEKFGKAAKSLHQHQLFAAIKMSNKSLKLNKQGAELKYLNEIQEKLATQQQINVDSYLRKWLDLSDEEVNYLQNPSNDHFNMHKNIWSAAANWLKWTATMGSQYLFGFSLVPQPLAIKTSPSLLIQQSIQSKIDNKLEAINAVNVSYTQHRKYLQKLNSLSKQFLAQEESAGMLLQSIDAWRNAPAIQAQLDETISQLDQFIKCSTRLVSKFKSVFSGYYKYRQRKNLINLVAKLKTELAEVNALPLLNTVATTAEVHRIMAPLFKQQLLSELSNVLSKNEAEKIEAIKASPMLMPCVRI